MVIGRSVDLGLQLKKNIFMGTFYGAIMERDKLKTKIVVTINNVSKSLYFEVENALL
jgi:hypothetical protein